MSVVGSVTVNCPLCGQSLEIKVVTLPPVPWQGSEWLDLDLNTREAWEQHRGECTYGQDRTEPGGSDGGSAA